MDEKRWAPFLRIQGHISMKYNILAVARLKSWGPDREILVANFNKKNFFWPKSKIEKMG